MGDWMRGVSAGLVCLFAWLGAGVEGAAAQAASDGPDEKPGGRLRDGPGLSITEENDVFDIIGDHSDRYYTQGLKFAYLTPANTNGDSGLLQKLAKFGLFTDGGKVREARGTLGIGQQIYTPEAIHIAAPNPNDRPYAGWLYLSAGGVAYDDTNLTAVELQVGLVGPSAHGGDTQNGYHKLIKAAEAVGWSQQLHDELGVNLYAEHRWRVGRKDNDAEQAAFDDRHFDVTPDVTLALGTVEDSIGGGVTARAGWRLNRDFGPARMRPGVSGSEFFDAEDGNKLSIYGFAGMHARLVARDVFLDGNTWVDSPSVNKRPLVGEGTAGLAVRWFGLRLAYTYVWRSEEFHGQDGHTEFGSLNLTYTRRG